AREQLCPPCISGNRVPVFTAWTRAAQPRFKRIVLRADPYGSVLGIGLCLEPDLVADFLVQGSSGVRRSFFDLDGMSLAVADFHPRSLERVVEKPPLGIGEAARRQRLVDLLHREEATPDPPGEERFPGLVRSANLQRGHQSPPTRLPPKPYPFPTLAAGFERRPARPARDGARPSANGTMLRQPDLAAEPARSPRRADHP